MLSPNFVIVTAIAYVGLMFAIAYAADRRARRGKGDRARRHADAA